MKNATRLIPGAVLTALSLLAASCSDDSAARNVVTVLEINNNSPLSSDVVDYGQDNLPGTSDDFIFEDRVTVELSSRPHDDVVDLFGSPYQYVSIERCRIEYESSEEIPAYEGAVGWTIQSTAPFIGSLTVVPANLKTRAPLSGLINGGEIAATAQITFYGHESGSGAPVKFEATLAVHFANWADQ